VLIHSSLNQLRWWEIKQDNELIEMLDRSGFGKKMNDTSNYPIGTIIGSVEITGCVTDSESKWAMPDHFHFTLAHAVRFPKPIPAKGKLGFWEYDAIKAEPEEMGGALFCHCQLAMKDEVQLYRDGNLVRCHYCGGIWYR